MEPPQDLAPIALPPCLATTFLRASLLLFSMMGFKRQKRLLRLMATNSFHSGLLKGHLLFPTRPNPNLGIPSSPSNSYLLREVIHQIISVVSEPARLSPF